MSRIISLQAENVKRLHAVHITPTGNLVLIGGNNGQGKTSVLDSIAMALGGAKEAPQQPIRLGQDRAQIVLETEELVITRTFTAAGSTLVVEDKNKMRATAPQAILDKLTAKLAFDPVAFMRLDPPKQREALTKLLAIDFTEQDAERAKFFTERTTINRQVDEAIALHNSLPHWPNTPAGEISVAEAVAELEAAQATNQKAKDLADAAESAAGAVMERQKEIHDAEQSINDIDRQIAALQHARTLWVEKAVEFKKLEIAAQTAAEEAGKLAAGAATLDLTPFREKIASAEVINSRVRANAKKEEAQKKLKALSEKAAELTKAIEFIDAAKAKIRTEAKYPVPGLGFDDRGVLFNNVPLSQASAAEQLRVSVAMAAALNPKLRVMIVRDASLLDEDSLTQLGLLAEEFDLQVWAERVGKGDKTAVIIQDGAVAPAEAVA